MNSSDVKYAPFALPKDMLATVEVIANFNADQAVETAKEIAAVGRLFFTGEGSSRIFPSKSVIAHARRQGWPIVLHTEGGKQAQQYKLDDWAVLAASNSGRTAEVIGLFKALREKGHQHLYSLTAFADSMLESLAKKGYVLTCGKEGSVAATKSVVEQALFNHALVEHIAGAPTLGSRKAELAAAFKQALTTSIDSDLIAKVANAGTIYFAGMNDGVAEELTLKTNEITRKRSDYLEGTYAAHGIEEIMDADDVVIWVNPFQDSEAKFEDVLVKGVGLTVIAIADRDTRFPTIRVPAMGDLAPYVMMAAGWNLLVETGIHLGVDLDKPVRARKVGNEFVG